MRIWASVKWVDGFMGWGGGCDEVGLEGESVEASGIVGGGEDVDLDKEVDLEAVVVAVAAMGRRVRGGPRGLDGSGGMADRWVGGEVRVSSEPARGRDEGDAANLLLPALRVGGGAGGPVVRVDGALLARRTL